MAVKQIFFSYSFKDEEKVLKVREILENVLDEEGNQKYSVFMASDPIYGNKSGRSWNSQEKRQMLNSFMVLFFLSDNSIISDGASQELDFYFNTMRKRGKEKFLYVSLNGKNMMDSVIDFMRNDASFIDDVLVETIVNRYESMLDEPDFRDNHLYLLFDDLHFKSRLETTVLEMYNSYNGVKNNDRYQKFLEKLEKIKEESIDKQVQNIVKETVKKEEEKKLKKEAKANAKEQKKNSKVIDSSLVDIFKQNEDSEEVRQNKILIKECFDMYSLDGEIINYYVGPSITLYEIKLGVNQPLNKFLKIREDLALKVGEIVRVVAPIPGRSTCGIEIPNKVKRVLKFGELLTEEFLNKGNSFTCVMGKNAFNEIKEYDITEMPHCLISGTTGSGAFNILNTIIVSALMKYTPDELKLVLADPHFVDFSAYENIPHLLYPLIKDASVGEPLFSEISEEIEKRYALLRDNKTRNIYQYNEIVKEKMPYILIVINEYSDFVLFNKKIENHIMRIVQLGRAVGVHFVLYTQRPSVDILTGTLKANFSTRITGKVVSFVDSRTIIDEGGAELLLGKGDALVKYQGFSERIQAALISEKELYTFCEAIVNKYGTTIKKEIPNNDINVDLDPLLMDVIDYLYEDKKLTISKLQIKLHIGYSRGVNILETLLDLGIVKREGSIAIPNMFKEDAIKLLKIYSKENK